jgi:hypothetical protein
MDHERRHHYRSPDDPGQLDASLRRFAILLISDGSGPCAKRARLRIAFEVASIKPSGSDLAGTVPEGSTREQFRAFEPTVKEPVST